MGEWFVLDADAQEVIGHVGCSGCVGQLGYDSDYLVGDVAVILTDDFETGQDAHLHNPLSKFHIIHEQHHFID